MDMAKVMAERRRELAGQKSELDRKISTLREQVAEVDRELSAIAAYDERMGLDDRARDEQVQARRGRRGVTRESVLAVVRAEVGGATRGGIIRALGVRGDRSGEIAVDNRLRELKRDGRVLHERRTYRAPGP